MTKGLQLVIAPDQGKTGACLCFPQPQVCPEPNGCGGKADY